MPVYEITGKTRAWVMLGHPAAHVRSPQLLNRLFREKGIDVIALAIDVSPADLPPLVAGLRGWRNLVGMGVTMPHKGEMVRICDEVVGLAKYINAVNVVRRDPDGRLIAGNTDGSGFLAGLREAGHDPAGKRVLLLGAGGAGRAIAFQLAQAGTAELVLSNRTASKAEALAARIMEAFPDAAVAVGPPSAAGFDIAINATPLGMQESDPLPFDVSKLEPSTLVAEVIASRERTPLLREAERRGCRIHSGLPMVSCQLNQIMAFLGLDEG